MLRLENVSLEIGEKKILDDINFELKKYKTNGYRAQRSR